MKFVDDFGDEPPDPEFGDQPDSEDEKYGILYWDHTLSRWLTSGEGWKDKIKAEEDATAMFAEQPDLKYQIVSIYSYEWKKALSFEEAIREFTPQEFREALIKTLKDGGAERAIALTVCSWVGETLDDLGETTRMMVEAYDN